MWQRIQTVFLVISIIALLVSLVMPIWTAIGHGETAESIEQSQILTPFYLTTTPAGQEAKVAVPSYMPYSITAMFAVAAITLSIIEITKYRARVTQMKIGALNSFFLVGVLLCSYYFSSQLSKSLIQGGGEYGPGMWLPGISVLANLLANRFIRKDEKLVRDSNRLR